MVPVRSLGRFLIIGVPSPCWAALLVAKFTHVDPPKPCPNAPPSTPAPPLHRAAPRSPSVRPLWRPPQGKPFGRRPHGPVEGCFPPHTPTLQISLWQGWRAEDCITRRAGPVPDSGLVLAAGNRCSRVRRAGFVHLFTDVFLWKNYRNTQSAC